MDGISNTFCLLPNALGRQGSTRSANLATLLDGYFARHGHHINVNVLRREVLQDAHLHPEKYPNLTIRVSGYAVRFNRLTPEQREEVMARTMHSATTVTMAKKDTDNLLYEDEKKEEVHFDELEGIEEGDAKLGCVYSLETFSTTDGPGIRTNIFLQGCPKKCLFCCNPETQALANPKQHPEFAMSSAEIGSLLSKYQEWLKPRGGGVTVSGGEAMLQPDFVADLFRRAKILGISTCLDTACYGNKRRWNKILPVTDNVLLCMKGMDNEIAAKVAQAPAHEMAKSKEFARYIHEAYPNIKITLRWVILKGMTDSDSELDLLSAFALELGESLHAIELIPYHELGKGKYASLNMAYPLEDMTSYKLEDALEVKKKLEAAGVRTILSSV
jgi:pyruvate formate lyase activating enzyme